MTYLFNEDLFDIIIQSTICLCVAVLFLAVFIDFALYSRKEQVQKERKSIVETGTMTAFFIAFYLILRSGAGVIGVSSEFIKRILMLSGTTIIVAGCIANIAGRFYLGKNWSNQIKIYQEQSLIRTGIYRHVRHPLYSSIIVMFYGATIVYCNAIAFLAVTLVFVPFMYYRAKQEEKMLQQRFPEYQEYRKSTGMLFPKLIKRRTKNPT